MSLSLGGLFDNLRPAKWRGIAFEMPDVSNDTGRRVQRFFFPGLDTTAHQDMGAMDGDLRVTGVIIGDDYAQRAQLMQQACRTAGPGTLVHPWYGELKMVLAEPASFAWSQSEIRFVRFSAVFQPFQEAPEPSFDTLGLLLLGIEKLKTGVRDWLRDLLAPVRLAFGIVSAVAGLGLWLKGSVLNLVGGLANGGAMLGLLGPDVAGLLALGSATPDASYGGTVADVLMAPAETIAGTTLPLAAPAIGAGGTLASTDVQLEAAPVAAALLDAASAAPAAGTVPAPVLLAVQLGMLAGGISAAARISYASRQDAMAWRARVDAAIVGRMAAVAAVALDSPARAGAVYQALADLRAAVAADFQAEIGRLPAVTTITVPGLCSVWSVASWLAGDNPALITPLVDDLVARNRLRLPGAIPAGTTLEYLA